MEITFPAKQMQAGNKANKAKIMVAMQMGNKNIIDLLKPYTVFSELNLCSFSTIKQE